MALSSVDLPAPLGPMMPTSSPSWHVEVAAVEDVDARARSRRPGRRRAARRPRRPRGAPRARGRRSPVGLGRRRRLGARPRRARRPGLVARRCSSISASASARICSSIVVAEVGVVVGAEVGVDDRAGRPSPRPAGPRRSTWPSAITTTQSEMSRTMSMSCSTNSTVMPSSRRRLDVAEQRLRERRVHAGHRLVEHDQLRVGHQRPGHLEQLALAAGQRCRRSRRASASSLNRAEQLVGLAR